MQGTYGEIPDLDPDRYGEIPANGLLGDGSAPHDYAVAYAQARPDSLTRESSPLYASGGDALYSTASSTGAGEDVSEGLYDLASNKKTKPSAKTKATKKGKGGTKNKTKKAKGNGKASNTSVYDLGTNNHAGEALYAEASNEDGYLNVGPEVKNATYDTAGNGGGKTMYDTAGNGGGEAMYDTAVNGGGEAMYDTAGNGDVAGSKQAGEDEVGGFGFAEEDDEE